jgi:hypothetical protein
LVSSHSCGCVGLRRGAGAVRCGRFVTASLAPAMSPTAGPRAALVAAAICTRITVSPAWGRRVCLGPLLAADRAADRRQPTQPNTTTSRSRSRGSRPTGRQVDMHAMATQATRTHAIASTDSAMSRVSRHGRQASIGRRRDRTPADPPERRPQARGSDIKEIKFNNI